MMTQTLYERANYRSGRGADLADLEDIVATMIRYSASVHPAQPPVDPASPAWEWRAYRFTRYGLIDSTLWPSPYACWHAWADGWLSGADRSRASAVAAVKAAAVLIPGWGAARLRPISPVERAASDAAQYAASAAVWALDAIAMTGTPAGDTARWNVSMAVVRSAQAGARV